MRSALKMNVQSAGSGITALAANKWCRCMPTELGMILLIVDHLVLELHVLLMLPGI